MVSYIFSGYHRLGVYQQHTVVEKTKSKQVLQQEAYPIIWRPVDTQNLAIPGAIPKIGENLSEIGQTAVQNFTPIGKAPAEKSVTIRH